MGADAVKLDQGDDSKTAQVVPDTPLYTLGVHDDTSLAEDVVFDPTAQFSEGTLLRIEHNTADTASHEQGGHRVYGSAHQSRSAHEAKKRLDAQRFFFVARKVDKDQSLKVPSVQVRECYLPL